VDGQNNDIEILISETYHLENESAEFTS